MYLFGCTITSKTKINVFWKNFFTPGPVSSSGPPTRILKKTPLILAFETNSSTISPNCTFLEVLTHCVIWSGCLFCTLVFPVMLLKCLHYDSGWVLNEGDCDEIGKDLFGWSGWEFHQFGHVEKGIYADEKSIPETNCCIEGQWIEPITFCNAPNNFIEQGQRCCGHYHNQRLKQTKIL